MKITRNELQTLINEEVARSNSVLLEMPVHSTTGMTMGEMDNVPDPENTENKTGMHLFHIVNQAQTLHAMMAGNSTPPISDQDRKTIEAVYKALDGVYKPMSHRDASTGVQE